jgi:type III pantothenate kinase
MNIAIDIGNSCIKAGYFDNNKLADKKLLPGPDVNWEENIPSGVSMVIISGSGEQNTKLETFLSEKEIFFHNHTQSSKIPIQIDYKTPDTLGLDRIAAAVGADSIFPEKTTLIIDAGTAITFDIVSKSVFLGGNISPGLSLRYRSLHQYTARLPLLSIPEKGQLFGKSTAEAIENGVFNGMLYEIEGTIKSIEALYGNINIILTGGDSQFFVNKIKKSIFVEPNLVLIGLNTILSHNV